ncbi:MAG TPA: hypothetical protein VGH37_18340, partial [Candidatus Acidoferrum sp.]
LVQLDGSFHAWFEERGPRGCLMNMVDDATGTTESRLGEQETMWAAVGVLRSWIGKYGVPRAIRRVAWWSVPFVPQVWNRKVQTRGARRCRRTDPALVALS